MGEEGRAFVEGRRPNFAAACGAQRAVQSAMLCHSCSWQPRQTACRLAALPPPHPLQALGERIRPVMTVNKIDRCFLELMLDPEEVRRKPLGSVGCTAAQQARRSGCRPAVLPRWGRAQH